MCEPLPEEQRQRVQAQAEETGLPLRIANACAPLDDYGVQ
jgi:hypothetical protein